LDVVLPSGDSPAKKVRIAADASGHLNFEENVGKTVFKNYQNFEIECGHLLNI
jgi:hypothetical protein